MQARLMLSGEEPAALVFDVVTVGRSDENDVCLPAADGGVSRRHCELRFQDGAFWLHDLDSANGSFVNEQRATQPIRLQQGDVVRCGNSRMVYLAGDGDLPRPRPSAVPPVHQRAPTIMAPVAPADPQAATMAPEVRAALTPPAGVPQVTHPPAAPPDPLPPALNPPPPAAPAPPALSPIWSTEPRLATVSPDPPRPWAEPSPVAVPAARPAPVATPTQPVAARPARTTTVEPFDLRVPVGAALGLGVASVFLPWVTMPELFGLRLTMSLIDVVQWGFRATSELGAPGGPEFSRVVAAVLLPFVVLVVLAGLLLGARPRPAAVAGAGGFGIFAALMLYALVRGGLAAGLDFGRLLGTGFWVFAAAQLLPLVAGLWQTAARSRFAA